MRLPDHRSVKVLWRCAAAAALGLAVVGCGEVSNTITPTPGTTNVVKVMLAGEPNAFYVGLYEAEALGYFRQTDIDPEIEVPSAGEDPVQQLHDGNVLVAFASTPTVLLHRNQDEPVVGVAAIVDVPLPTIKVRVTGGSTGSCSDTASGGAGLTPTTTTPSTAATVTTAAPTTTTAAGTSTCTTTSATTDATTNTSTTALGTVTTSSTTTTSVASNSTSSTATTITPSEPDSSQWPATLQTLITGSGAPSYDGLVVVVRKGTIVDHAPLIRRFVQALARGYRAARANPVSAVQNLDVQVPALAASATLQLATVKAALPYFFPSTGQIWGWQASALWNTFGTWMMNHKVITNPNALTDASTNELLQGEGV